MDKSLAPELIELRAVIGYLGEREQFAWWPSSFFAAGSEAFLSPLFPRTRTLAQIVGVSRAATRVHDERIGVGGAYHLFRLPEEIEQAIHRHLLDFQAHQALTQQLTDRASALGRLAEVAQPTVDAAAGPLRIDEIHGVYTGKCWSLVAAHYLAAFDRGSETFPYFSDNAT